MNLANMFIIVFMTYYSNYFISLFRKKNRQGVQYVNKGLDEIRKKPIKTLEEQKAFINLKYPKKPKFKWSWKMIPYTLYGIVKFIIIFYIYNYLFNWLKLDFKLWQAILFIIVAPILINLLLEKFKLQRQDLRVFLK